MITDSDVQRSITCQEKVHTSAGATNRSLQLQAALGGPETILLVQINASHCERGH
jgi:hypothetical protein